MSDRFWWQIKWRGLVIRNKHTQTRERTRIHIRHVNGIKLLPSFLYKLLTFQTQAQKKKKKHWTSQKVIVGNNKYDLKRRTQILLNASFLFISAFTPHFPRQKPSVSKMPSRVEKNLKTSHVLLIHLLQKQQVSWALCWELFLLFPRSRVCLNIY